MFQKFQNYFKTVLNYFGTISKLLRNILKYFEFSSKHHRDFLYRHCYLPLLIETIRGNSNAIIALPAFVLMLESFELIRNWTNLSNLGFTQ